MKRYGLFVFLLASVIAAGVIIGLALKFALKEDPSYALQAKAAQPSTSVSKKLGFMAEDAAGEISAEISQFKAGISGTYVEVLLTNISQDRTIDVAFIKVVFFDGKGAFLDYGEGRLGKTLKPGESSSSFLYMAKGRGPAFYNESAKAVCFDRIGSSKPCKKNIQQL